jgi:hypothetical protein
MLFREMSETNLDKDLYEICYELTDTKFNVNIYDTSTGWGSIPVYNRWGGTGVNPPQRDTGDKLLFISLSDYKDYDGFSFDEVREVVLRVVDYLGDRYKSCSVLSVGESERSSINKKEITDHYWIGNLTNLVIIYQ